MTALRTKGGASAPSAFTRGDYIGLAVFLAPVAVAALHWAGGLF